MPEIYEENNIVIILNYDAKQFNKGDCVQKQGRSIQDESPAGRDRNLNRWINRPEN